MWKVYLESVYMFALLATRVSALVSAISSAYWEEVPEGMGWESITSDNCMCSYLFFPSDVIAELPSIYQVKSGLFKGVEEMWEKWGIRSSNASLQVWVGLRRIRDEGGRVESRTEFKGKRDIQEG